MTESDRIVPRHEGDIRYELTELINMKDEDKDPSQEDGSQASRMVRLTSTLRAATDVRNI